MVNLLTNLLTPIFGPMGVSAADLQSYLEICINYVYVILAALVVMIIVLVATIAVRHWKSSMPCKRNYAFT